MPSTTLPLLYAQKGLLTPFLMLFLAGVSGEACRGQARVFRPKDHVCIVGGALAERMQHDGWLETALQARLPRHQLTVRNLGFAADTLTVRQRTTGFGTPDEHLTRCSADVILAFFGYNESFAGRAGRAAFKNDLTEFINHTLSQRYNATSPPRLVLCSPTAYENLNDPNLPDGADINAQLADYVSVMAEVARARDVAFIDLFRPTLTLYAENDEPLTINGAHFNSTGNQLIAEHIAAVLLPPDDAPLHTSRLENIRAAVLEKNLLWFNRYRATDGYNVYGGRSSLQYTDGMTNFTVLQRELEILDVMVANRDARIWAIAAGGDMSIDDSNAPPSIVVPTNKPGPAPTGAHVFPSGTAAIDHMDVAEGLRVHLYADEARFPELVNPVQMSWDTRDRLWVAAWPTYPHWAPGQPMNDKLLILEDTDGDGAADTCKTFAGDLHNPTGFEFWMGGVLVAQPPDLLLLRDTDGDDVADERIRLLHGFSSADTHHSINSFVIGPDGALYMQEGTFHQSQIETIYGPMRNHNGAVWRFEPRTFRVERFIPYDFANPHGHVFDRWGQNFVTDGTGNSNYFALGFSGYLAHPDKHRGYPTYFKQRSRPCAATEILSSAHFPDDMQGNLLIADVIQFKGLMQYRFHDDGSGFGATETTPIVHSPHPTFRPSDIEVGPDGALYFLDWTNPLIGHMQHHLRDPSRDHEHGRVYRITVTDRPLITPPRIAGQPLDHLLALLAHPNDRVRYRTRIELSARSTDDVLGAARRWIADLDPSAQEYEHHLLEGLWLHQQHNRIDLELLEQLLVARDFRARAAAVRVLRYMRRQIPNAVATLERMAHDPHPRVRLEVIVAASFFDEPGAVTAVLETLRHDSDRTLNYAREETMRALMPIWKSAIRAGRPLAVDNPAAEADLLARVNAAELIMLPPSSAVYRAWLTRPEIPLGRRRDAARHLARDAGTTPPAIVLDMIRMVGAETASYAATVVHELGQLLLEYLAAGQTIAPRDVHPLLDVEGPARQLGFALLLVLDTPIPDVWTAALTSTAHLRDLLVCVPLLPDPALRAALADDIRALMFALPTALQNTRTPGMNVAYYLPHPPSADRDVFDTHTPVATGSSPSIGLDIPLISRRDQFGLRFSGGLTVAADGTYTFYTNSDDGSRLYVDDHLVVDNDGPHGMVEKSGTIDLSAGDHDLLVTYYDQGGGDGLIVSWAGPGFAKQPIPTTVLSADTYGAVHSAAIRAMASVPGREAEKLRDAALLLGAGSHVEPAVALVESVPEAWWSLDAAGPLIETIAAHLAGLDADGRTRPAAQSALALARRLVATLAPPARTEAEALLDGLGGTVVLIRTVPHQMLYDVTAFQVAAGQPVALILQNNDLMPHNLLITRPGRLSAIGMAAEHLATAAGAMAPSNYVPNSTDVLHFTRLLQPGDTQRLTFTAPAVPGDYPFVCTFPGHWMRMNGIMRVVDNVSGPTVLERTANVETVVMRPFVKNWTLDDFSDTDFTTTPRSRRRGAQLFCEIGCNRCHVRNGAGGVGGPDLTNIHAQYRGRGLLTHLLEPSRIIAREYVFYTFVLDDGTEYFARVVSEDDSTLELMENLQQPDRRLKVDRDRIVRRIPSRISPMPSGQLVILTREEILDLVAFLER